MLFGLEIGHGGPVLDPACPRDGTTAKKQGLGERRLPEPPWPTRATLRTFAGGYAFMRAPLSVSEGRPAVSPSRPMVSPSRPSET